MVIDTTRLLEIASRSLAAGEQEVGATNGGIDLQRLLDIASETVGRRGVTTTPKKDLGVVGAFGAGLEKGIKEPFRLLGVEPREVELDETSEQVANFLGSMVGLGISFVPFAFGTGIVLRGLGLTAKVVGGAITAQEAARSQALFNFVRNTAAGATQFAGTSEEVSEVPGKIATGAAFGAAIEGVFLARAMRGRRGSVGKDKLFDDGNPIPDKPVDLDQIALEVEISPSVNKTTERMVDELNSTFTENKPWEEVITDLLGDHVETVRLTGRSRGGAESILAYAKENFPSAQRLSRVTQVKGVHEVLLHQPFDPANILTKQQISQWKATGYASGERLVYAGRTVEATGAVVEPGFVQVRVPLQKGKRQGVPFAAPVEEVTRPVTTQFFNESAVRTSTLQAAVRSIDDRVGFVVPASTVGQAASLSARRGFVDVTEFETAASFDAFAKPFIDDIASVQAANSVEAVGILAQQTGIPGLRTVDEGVTTRIHIFDQKKLSFVSEPPRVALSSSEVRPIGRPAVVEVAEGIIPEPVVAAPGPRDVPNLGLVLDDAVFSTSLSGEPVLSSFVPSWRNSVSAPLREAGFPEKEIAQYLDLYAANTSKRLDALMDPEFQAIKNASEIQFGGCP